MKDRGQHFFPTHSDTKPWPPGCLGGTGSPRVPGCTSGCVPGTVRSRAGAASEEAGEINQKDTCLPVGGKLSG